MNPYREKICEEWTRLRDGAWVTWDAVGSTTFTTDTVTSCDVGNSWVVVSMDSKGVITFENAEITDETTLTVKSK